MYHLDDLTTVQSAFARLEECGTAEVTYHRRLKNGDYRGLYNQIYLTKDSAGRPLYQGGKIRVITEHKQIEEELLAEVSAKKAVEDHINCCSRKCLEKEEYPLCVGLM